MWHLGTRGKEGAWTVRTLMDREASSRPERKTILIARELARYHKYHGPQRDQTNRGRICGRTERWLHLLLEMKG